MQDLNKPLKEDYNFDLSKYVKNGWELFKSQAGSFIGMTLLFVVILLIISIIPVVGALNNLISALLFSGIFVFCRHTLLKNQKASHFFEGFNYAGKIILFRILYFLLLIPFLLLFFIYIIPFDQLYGLINETIDPEEFQYIMANKLNDGLGIGILLVSSLVMLFGAIYLSVSYLFTVPLIVDSNLNFWEAMELSRKVIGKKFFSFLLGIILISVAGGLGMVITCGLGALIVLPLWYCIIFSAYDDIFQPNEAQFKSNLDSFGEAEGDINTESQELDN